MNKKIVRIFRNAVCTLLAVIAVLCVLETYVGLRFVDLSGLDKQKKEYWRGVPPSMAATAAKCGTVNKAGQGRSETAARENVWPDGQRVSRPDMNREASKRVLLVGCSYTFGMGIEDQETLAWLLNEHYPDAVFDNYAVSAFGTYQCLMMMQDRLAERKYDAVLYMYIDDHVRRHDMWRVHGRLTPGGYFVVTPAAVFKRGRLCLYPSNYFQWPFQDNSALVDFAHTLYVASKVRHLNEKEAGMPIAVREAEDLKGWRVVQALTKMMDEACREKGSRFGVVMLTPNRCVHDASANDWPCAYTDVSFPEIYDPEYRNGGYTDWHPNGAAQKRWFAKLVPWLDSFVFGDSKQAR